MKFVMYVQFAEQAVDSLLATIGLALLCRTLYWLSTYLKWKD